MHTVEPPLTASSPPHRPPLYNGYFFFVLVDGPYIYSYLNPSTTVTATKARSQLPKETSRQRQVHQQLTNGINKTPFFYWKRPQNLIHTVRRVICLCFCLVSVLLIYFDYVMYLHATL